MIGRKKVGAFGSGVAPLQLHWSVKFGSVGACWLSTRSGLPSSAIMEGELEEKGAGKLNAAFCRYAWMEIAGRSLLLPEIPLPKYLTSQTIAFEVEWLQSTESSVQPVPPATFPPPPLPDQATLHEPATLGPFFPLPVPLEICVTVMGGIQVSLVGS